MIRKLWIFLEKGDIKLYQRRKRQTVQDSLKEQITTKHIINASFAQGYYFEFLFKNPYSSDQNYVISWENDSLRLIGDIREWEYHRQVNGNRMGVEKNMVSVRPDGTAQIFLVANETISVPFIYQNFVDETTSNIYDPSKREIINSELNHQARSIFVNLIFIDRLLSKTSKKSLLPF